MDSPLVSSIRCSCYYRGEWRLLDVMNACCSLYKKRPNHRCYSQADTMAAGWQLRGVPSHERVRIAAVECPSPPRPWWSLHSCEGSEIGCAMTAEDELHNRDLSRIIETSVEILRMGVVEAPWIYKNKEYSQDIILIINKGHAFEWWCLKTPIKKEPRKSYKAINMVVFKNTDLFYWFASCRSKTI